MITCWVCAQSMVGGKKCLKHRHGGPRKGAGRPTEDEAEGTKRYNVSLDRETVKQAKKIGDGNLSLGIRKAVKAV